MTKMFGEIKVMLLGLFVMLTSLILLFYTNSTTSYYTYALFLLIYDIGGGFFMAPNWIGIIKTVNVERQGTIGAYKRMIQNVSIAATVAVVSVFLYSNTNNSTSD
jgi:MFS family permease